MPTFLTDDWFSNVENLTAQAGDLNLPPALANLAINLVVTDSQGNTELSLDGGAIKKGLSPNAKTTLNMDGETLRKVFLEFDMAAAMQAFMTGKIKVQGDMSQLMALQTAKPSQEQKDLFKKVLEQTT
ncbi:SCP2 sterol-binding domain-containing protein [Acinetobacter terrae]|jgi:putative sterol carrier protein|uniref:SCP-2 sterol transfer family protein n=1 Tax=Acinetobacter terrae TaxID=2731247 RepID=A0A241VH81_9GAMM|nr:SCP2 sterol-binding domain-containing protein [Acinetobacter terrae]NNH15744.1 SCP2 sterol-binding domain-containing protein [Acinetobacter terrae]NNH77239.1 SCP2 sterol-binding domain-containing protein [Acinetobacter terrae]OAL84638.1 SCP-2 sterol transfer family protein [Acinetobacter terrae]OTG76822.1 SCP-2 sterol transfer family protein [Acinetobacter terrae]TCB61063.1 SCP-2 sterol transfer family protein [Acinetobacter terrae]